MIHLRLSVSTGLSLLLLFGLHSSANAFPNRRFHAPPEHNPCFGTVFTDAHGYLDQVVSSKSLQTQEEAQAAMDAFSTNLYAEAEGAALKLGERLRSTCPVHSCIYAYWDYPQEPTIMTTSTVENGEAITVFDGEQDVTLEASCIRGTFLERVRRENLERQFREFPDMEATTRISVSPSPTPSASPVY